MIFWLVWGFCNLDRAFTFQCGFVVVGVGLIDFGVIVLNLDSFLGDCFILELGGVKEWTSGGVASMVDITGGFLGVVGIDDVSCVKSQISVSSMSSLALTSKISSITFVMVEGS